MPNKQIITLVIVIFLALIGYKLISSSIQENKEKAVMEEKARLQELSKEPLNKCIEDIDNKVKADIKYFEDLALDSNIYNSCLQATDHGRAVNELITSGKMTPQEYCMPPSFKDRELEEQKIRDKAQTQKDECYKRYK